MKKSILLIALGLLSCIACKKDQVIPKKAFEDITYTDIKKFEHLFSSQEIKVSSAANGDILKEGSIILYKTNVGVLGKFKLVSISAQNLLTIDVVNYDASTGSESLNTQGATIFPTWGCDLDMGQQTPSSLLADFDWSIESLTDRRFILKANVYFYVYSK